MQLIRVISKLLRRLRLAFVGKKCCGPFVSPIHDFCIVRKMQGHICVANTLSIRYQHILRLHISAQDPQ